MNKHNSILILLVVLILLGVSLACGAPSQPAPTLVPTATIVPTPTPTTYQVYLYCADCVELGMDINLWETVDRQNLVTTGSAPNHAQVTLLEWQEYDGVMYFKVEYQGQIGWVSEQMVSKEPTQ